MLMSLYPSLLVFAFVDPREFHFLLGLTCLDSCSWAMQTVDFLSPLHLILKPCECLHLHRFDLRPVKPLFMPFRSLPKVGDSAEGWFFGILDSPPLVSSRAACEGKQHFLFTLKSYPVVGQTYGTDALYLIDVQLLHGVVCLLTKATSAV